MEYGLLGETLGHSFSPQIHQALAGYGYELLPTPPEKVEELFRQREFKGLNVTIPYKQTVIPLCDSIDPRASAIGAVNTVVNNGGHLTGYNTDIDGLIYLARRTGVDMKGKKVVVLGSGGTSRTAQSAAKELGASEIVVVSRRGENNYDSLARHANAQVLINTTPVGMYPNCGVSPVSLDAFPNLTGVLDVVFNPLHTALLMQAEKRGLPCSCGLPMLVAQAKRAAELFTGKDIPDSRIEEVLSELTAQLQNIVLIGMPGCGKTSIGAALAKLLRKRFIDLDGLTVQKAGKEIPEIFAGEGEAAFRDLESGVVREAGKNTGCVISTGGGVVLREENYAPLHQNGVIFHLTRSLDALPVDGRPVSQSTALSELWERRAPLYAAFADHTAGNDGTPEETLEKIVKELNGL
ncbi:MAG: AAA family ATPase [Oscillospiraceae bacterium]|nr:AAA family ATPase [Oscillospiraceae bacterium]